MNSIGIRRGLLALQGCCVLLLAGCFDYEETFHLEADGSGTVMMVTTFASDMMPNLGEGKMETDSAVVSSASVERHQEMKEGKMISTERAAFNSLDGLALEDRVYRIERLAPPGRYRLSAMFLMDEDSDPFSLSSEGGPDTLDGAAMEMMSSMFAGHQFTVHLEVPGEIVEAATLEVGGREIIPARGESSATFAIPMEALFASGGPQTMSLTVDFEADLVLDAERIESVKVESTEPTTPEFTFPSVTDQGEPLVEPFQPARPMGEEEKAYIPNLDIRNVKVDRLVEPPEVSGEIKNQGTRTVGSIGVIVYCLDAEGQAMAEARETVLDSRRGDSPLRPNYSKKFRISLVDIASDWSGQVKVNIDSMTLAE